MAKKQNKKTKLKGAIGKATAWVVKNLDKIDVIFDVLRILGTDSKDEVVQYTIQMNYKTEEGKEYILSLPMSQVKDSSDVQNTLASIIVAAADDINAKVEEIKQTTTKTSKKKEESKDESK